MQKKTYIVIFIICAIVVLAVYQSDVITKFEFLGIPESRHIINPPIYEQNIDKFLKINNLEDVYQKRAQLVHHIWKKDIMSADLPSKVIFEFNDSQFSDLDNLERIEKLEISMDKGVNSIAYHFIPKISNQKLIIYHQGHDGGFILGKETINYLLKNNYAVLAFSMPLIGENNKPITDTEFGRVQLLSHRYFELLESPNFNPMIFFFEPINISLNYLEENYTYDEYDAVGISGGGWTVTVYSAIDSRVTKTFSIAGSVPFFLRTTEDNVGDYEQISSDFYRIADYMDLYLMASAGEHRKFIQIFNKYDPCCFYGDQFEMYGDIIKAAIGKMSNGYFEIYLDSSTKRHGISEHALKIIETELE